PAYPLQHALKDLGRACKNFFAKRAGSPRVAKKGQRESFRYPDAKHIKLNQANSRIFLPKLGWRDGTFLAPLDSFKKHEIRLHRYQQVRNMSQSAAGSTGQPGKNVKANSGLNNAILDQGWSGLRRQLEYKLAWAGGWP